MGQRISGPGVGLALPQNLYPSELPNANLDTSSNKVTIPAGAAIPVPAGEYFVGLGMYLLLQYLDPITNTWVTGASGGWEGPTNYVFSDGYNVRVANLLACPIGAVITNAGSGYVQASTTIAVTGGGGSTWAPIVGTQLIARQLVNCRTHEHRHFERTLRSTDTIPGPRLAEGRSNKH